MVQCNIDIQDIAVDELALVGDAVANDFVEGGTDGFGEVTVVKGGGV